MKSGMYLEFRSPTDCKLYGPKGEFLQDVPIEGKIPILNAGDNEVSFTCDGPNGVNARVQVTVIGEGSRYKNNKCASGLIGNLKTFTSTINLILYLTIKHTIYGIS
jgi:hypothetical protein